MKYLDADAANAEIARLRARVAELEGAVAAKEEKFRDAEDGYVRAIARAERAEAERGRLRAELNAKAHHELILGERIARAEAERDGLRKLLTRLLAHDCAEDCQECGIGQSEAWKDARAALAKL